jgi:thiol-disulfide isomerase/thioredoxin
MKNQILIILLVCFSKLAVAQEVPVVKFEDLKKILENKESEIVIINFWATWCAPCVAELPVFDKYFAERPANTVIYLINLDFVDKISRVKSFIKRKSLRPPVMLLDETDYNTWIDKVDSSWEGTIPATLVLNTKTGKRKFVGKELSDTDLQLIIKEVKTQ